jgi:hypothetical protein
MLSDYIMQATGADQGQLQGVYFSNKFKKGSKTHIYHKKKLDAARGEPIEA